MEELPEVGHSKTHVIEPEKIDHIATDLVLPAGHGNAALYVCRIALALLRLPRDTESMFMTPEATELGNRVESDLRKSLGADSRVSELIGRSERRGIDNVRTFLFYDPTKTSPNLKSVEDDVFRSIRLPEDLIFRLKVPQRVQPKYRGVDDVPTDSYTVIWNGVVAVVQWRDTTGMATMSGGHVVLDVLKEVAVAAGYGLEILGCDPTCLHKFIHADVVTFDHDHEPPETFEVSGESSTGETIVSPFGYTDDDMLNIKSIYSALYSSVEKFAEAKTVADRIRAVEWFARENASALLLLNYRKMSRARLPRPRAVKELWELRNFRKESRELVAAMWLSLATVEDLRRFWRHQERNFTSRLKENDLGAFEDSLGVNHEEIDSLDMSLVREAVQDAGTRLDGRALILATTLGASAILIAAFLTRLWAPIN